MCVGQLVFPTGADVHMMTLQEERLLSISLWNWVWQQAAPYSSWRMHPGHCSGKGDGCLTARMVDQCCSLTEPLSCHTSLLYRTMCTSHLMTCCRTQTSASE